MPRTVTPWGAWDPADPAEVAALFRTGGAPWWIAGGYAIELAVGRPVRDIWCRPGTDRPWRIQVMLDESDGARWVSRRDRRVSRPVARLGHRTVTGIPYLAPEVQLFYKARSARPKDEADFCAALPILTPFQREWLRRALTLAYGGHRWCPRLQAS
jgi:hypothetical protein